MIYLSNLVPSLVLVTLVLGHPAYAHQALNLDGVDDYVRQAAGIVSPSTFDLQTFTIEGWIYPTGTGTMYLFSDSAYDLQLDDTTSAFWNVRLTLYWPGPGGFFTLDSSGPAPALNQWNHVAAGFDALSNHCFVAVNGHVDVRVGCVNGNLDTGFDQLFGIGTPYAGNSNGDFAFTSLLFKGHIFGVRLSNTLRYTANFTPACPHLDASTVAVWKFAELNGITSFSDLASSGQTLTGINGAATTTTGLAACTVRSTSDFDGDAKSDVGIYRNGTWSILRSSNGTTKSIVWGGPGWIPIPADYDGDGITDVAVYNNGLWSIVRSSDGGNTLVQWSGTPGDIPVVADYDGDGKADLAVYNSNSAGWSIIRSSDQGLTYKPWGGPAWQPVVADYDGDGKADIAVYNGAGLWSIVRSSDGGNTLIWWSGAAADIPVPADYDGDGKADLAVYNSVTSGWSIIRSSDQGLTYKPWGGPAWQPVVADYDGDGKADIAVYNSSNGLWSIVRSSDGANTLLGWGGAPQDVPLN